MSSRVNVDFINTGSDTIQVSITDKEGMSSVPIDVRPNTIVRRPLVVNEIFSIFYDCGPFRYYASPHFTNNRDIDVKEGFNSIKFTNTGSEVIKATINDKGSRTTEPFYIYPNLVVGWSFPIKGEYFATYECGPFKQYATPEFKGDETVDVCKYFISVNFTNTGSEIIIATITNKEGMTTEPFVIKPGVIVRRSLPAKKYLSAIYECGPLTHCASPEFENNETVDVSKYFVSVNFTNTCSEIIMATIASDEGMNTESFAVRPDIIVRRSLPTKEDLSATYECGLFIHRTSHKFRNNETVDVSTYFVSVNFTNTSSEIIMATITNKEGMTTDPFAIKPQEIVRRTLPAKKNLSATYECGPFAHFSQYQFRNNEIADVSKYFISVTFTNSGSEIITISFDDQNGTSTKSPPVHPKMTVRRYLPIDGNFSTTYDCGHFASHDTRKFGNNETVDVSKYFTSIDFANSGSEIIMATIASEEGMNTDTFAVKPDMIVRRSLPAKKTLSATYECGPFTHRTSHEFTTNCEIDVNKSYFINVDFTNTGSEIIKATIIDKEGRSSRPFDIRPKTIVRRSLPINVKFSTMYDCGRFAHNATPEFTNDCEIDVKNGFNNVKFTNTGSEVITATVTDQKGTFIGPFSVRPNMIVRRSLPINTKFSARYACGRFVHYDLTEFTDNETVDVSKYFIIINFTNSGSEIITVSFFDQNDTCTGLLPVRPKTTIRRSLPINENFTTTYDCGHFKHYDSREFANNCEIDVNNYFNNVNFTNSGNEVITAIIIDQEGRSTGPFDIHPKTTSTVSRGLPINEMFSATYVRGRSERHDSPVFRKNETIDVNKYFI